MLTPFPVHSLSHTSAEMQMPCQSCATMPVDALPSEHEIAAALLRPRLIKRGGRSETALELTWPPLQRVLQRLDIEKPLRFASLMVAHGTCFGQKDDKLDNSNNQFEHQLEHCDDAQDPGAERMILYLTDVWTAEQGALELEGVPVLGPKGTFARYSGATLHRGLRNVSNEDRIALALAFSRSPKQVFTIGGPGVRCAWRSGLTITIVLQNILVFSTSPATLKVETSSAVAVPFTLLSAQVTLGNGNSDVVAFTPTTSTTSVALTGGLPMANNDYAYVFILQDDGTGENINLHDLTTDVNIGVSVLVAAPTAPAPCPPPTVATTSASAAPLFIATTAVAIVTCIVLVWKMSLMKAQSS